MSSTVRGALRRPGRPLAALTTLIGIVLLTQAAAATPNLSGTEALTQAPGGIVDAPAPESQVPLMLELKQPAAAEIYAGQKDSGASNAAAGQDAAAQKSRNEAAQATVLKLLAAKSVEVLYQVQTAYNGIAVQASPLLADDLGSLPGVEAVHRIPLELRSNANTVPLIGAPAVWQSTGHAGEGIRIGVIDTGIDYVHTNFGGTGSAADLAVARSAATNPLSDTTSHPTGFSVVNASGTQLYPSAKVVGGFDFSGDAYTGGAAAPRPDPNPEDCPSSAGGGHGSHTSGTAAGLGVNADGTTYTGPYDSTTPFSTLRIGPGVAPKAQLYMLRVFGCTGSTGLTTQAIDWAVDPNGDGNPSDHLDVLNMSLGSPTGSDDDPSAASSNNASAAGVVVVTSAGNSGDTFYVSGSPGSATRAISTAATTDDLDITDGFQVVAPAAAAAVLPASRSSAFAAWTTPAGFSVTADLYYPNTNQYGCAAWTDAADTAAITGKIVLVDWKKPADAAFPCGSAVRANNATAAGAVGVIMVDTTPWLDTAIAGNASIPAMYSTVDVGNRLRGLLAAGTVTLRLTNVYNNSAKLHVEGWNDTVSSFSSRGPQGRVNGLKPDLAAPGQGIFSTDAGTLSQGKSLNGTSMASPHVAGVMALLKQAHPTWTVEELKALAINTASQDLFTGLGHTGDKYGAGRVGAGRVNVPGALSTDAVAYVDGGSGAVSVSFGALQVAGTRSYERTVKVENLGASEVTYSLGFDTRVAPAGVSVSFPDGGGVTVPAGQSRTFRVALSVDSSQLRAVHESTVKETQPTQVGVLPRHWLTEFNGLVTLTPASGTALRLPVYAVVRPASTMGTIENTVGVLASPGSTQLHLAGTGINTGGTTNQDYHSLVSAFELQGRSGQATLPAGWPESARDADIRQVGVTSDSKSSATPMIYFAVTTWKDWSTPGEVSFDVYIDTGGANGSAPDYRLFVARLADGTNPVDVWVTALATLPSVSGPIQANLNVFNSGLNTALFNNNQVIIPVNAAALGMTAGATRFNYTVTAASRFWDTVDTVGPYSFDYMNPGIDFSGGHAGLPVYDDLPGNAIPAAFDQAAFAANGSLGALLLHHFNTGPSRAQELGAGVVSATNVAVRAPAVEYSDPATLTAKLTAATPGADPLTGVVTFTLEGVAVGSAPVDSSGVATLAGLPNQRAPGSYPVTATFVSSSAYAGGAGAATLTVTKETAVAAPGAADPEEVGVTAPASNKSKPFTLSANVTEADGNLGNIANAQPVTFTLTPLVAGTAAPAPCAATTAVSDGTLTATCSFANLPVNVYDVAIGVGGSYYTGSGRSVVTVFDSSAGETSAAGAVAHDGFTSAFGVEARYRKGKPNGSFLFVQIDRAARTIAFVKSTSISSIAVTGKTAVIQGKAVISGVGSGRFRLTLVDNAKNGKGDTIALLVTGPSGATVVAESFPATPLSSGNVRVTKVIG